MGSVGWGHPKWDLFIPLGSAEPWPSPHCTGPNRPGLLAKTHPGVPNRDRALPASCRGAAPAPLPAVTSHCPPHLRGHLASH